MYIDDIKLFAKNEKELESVIHTIRIYAQGIGMEFGIEKCAMLIMKSGKRHLTKGMELQNQDKFRTLGNNGTYKYWEFWRLTSSNKCKWKKKVKKNISGELETYLRQNSLSETLSK